MSKKKDKKFNYFMDKVLNLNGLFDAAKCILILTVSAMSIHYLVNIATTIDIIFLRVVIYCSIPLIPIALFTMYFEDAMKYFKKGKKKK